MTFACLSYAIRMSLLYQSNVLVCHSHVLVYYLYVLVRHPYVICKHSYIINKSLVCTGMSSVCHSYVLLCHPHITRMWFYHEPVLMVYPSSTTYLLPRLPHTGLYNYNGRQIELFHMKWLNCG